jgi:hypothetical protein
LKDDCKIIHFEEYEPFVNGNSNRGGNLGNPYSNAPYTGGRHNSQSASNNSNRFSFSKTFNFHMALNNVRQGNLEPENDDYGVEEEEL